MSFDLNTLFSFMGNASMKLITLAANAEGSIQNLEAKDPLVAAAVTAATQEVPVALPQVGEGLAIANAVLGLAQTIANSVQHSSGVESAPSAKPAAAENAPLGERLPEGPTPAGQ